MHSPSLCASPGKRLLRLVSQRAGIGKAEFLDNVLYVQEYCWSVLHPGPATHGSGLITLVLDLKGLTFLGTLSNSEIVGIIKGCVQITSTHYPQRSDKILILNVPSW